MQRLGWIYFLLEPDSDEVRYVGQTKSVRGPADRLAKHVYDAKVRTKESNHRLVWLRSLAAEGERPRMQLVAQVPLPVLDSTEIVWIAYMKSLGCDLVNSTRGGTGGATRTGMKTPPETAAKQGAAWLGRKHRSETIAKMSARRTAQRSIEIGCIVCHDVLGGGRSFAEHYRYRHGDKSYRASCIKCRHVHTVGWLPRHVRQVHTA